MLLREYKYQLFMPECDHSSPFLNALAAFSDDIREVMPYLNASIKGCQYNHEAGIISFNYEGKRVTLYPRRAAIGKIEDKEDAEKTLESLKDLINRTYETRESIKPDFRSIERPKPLDIYKFLPGENCKKCGEATCLAFAISLIAEKSHLTACSPLYSGIYEEKRAHLEEMLLTAGYSLSGKQE